ncbi:cct chaperonin gamma subunit [Cyclospora cayetanensis]|uniref:T-complex protein 1 subunit gamma n=1 Tax=Cyclospora cayetanensis TaxID=88456 RepID=A0A1D3D702_9EIME|nr:cct chaperonin gamma subunit [Cyclospora cayetanensis]
MIRPRGPVLVLKQNTKRETGRKAQLANIQASKAIADIVRTTLGPSSMLKMLLDPMGGIVLTNDGNSILRESELLLILFARCLGVGLGEIFSCTQVDVAHPAAKTMIELSRSQDEEAGDGSTSVVVLSGELLSCSVDLLEKQQLHPAVISRGFMRALEDALGFLDELSRCIDTSDDSKVVETLDACLNTKFASRWQGLLSSMALKAVRKIARQLPSGKTEIDIKRYCKVEKVPGGSIEESCMLNGLMINKDVLLLDCPLEYKKGESQASVEVTKEDEWRRLLEQEEQEVHAMCQGIIESGATVVITEKGVSDLAQHFLVKAGISVIRRVRKTDNNRISRATGATIVSRTDEILESDLGTKCGLFQVKKIGDEYFTFLLECEEGSACTIVLRGGSKDVLNEVERNLQDALHVARNILLEGKLLPGGGAAEMAVAARLLNKAKSIDSLYQYSYRAVAAALEVIPRTLAQNCGANVVRVMTDLRAKHSRLEDSKASCMGVDGETGELCNMQEKMVWDCLSVKQQIYKAAIEAAAVLLRIDDVLSGVRKEGRDGGAQGDGGAPEDMETFGDSRDG